MERMGQQDNGEYQDGKMSYLLVEGYSVMNS
jgi:hypothetical protein